MKHLSLIKKCGKAFLVLSLCFGGIGGTAGLFVEAHEGQMYVEYPVSEYWKDAPGNREYARELAGPFGKKGVDIRENNERRDNILSGIGIGVGLASIALFAALFILAWDILLYGLFEITKTISEGNSKGKDK